MVTVKRILLQYPFFYAQAIKNRFSNDIGFGLIVLLTRGGELFQRIRNGTKKIF